MDEKTEVFVDDYLKASERKFGAALELQIVKQRIQENFKKQHELEETIRESDKILKEFMLVRVQNTPGEIWYQWPNM